MNNDRTRGRGPRRTGDRPSQRSAPIISGPRLELLGRVRKIFGRMCLIDFRQGVEYVTKLDNLSFLRTEGSKRTEPAVGDFIQASFGGITAVRQLEETHQGEFLVIESGFVFAPTQRQLQKVRTFEQLNQTLEERIKIFANDYVLLAGTADQIRQTFVKLQKIIYDEPI